MLPLSVEGVAEQLGIPKGAILIARESKGGEPVATNADETIQMKGVGSEGSPTRS